MIAKADQGRLFSNLLISSPNGGGLFLVDGAVEYRLDSIDTTGLAQGGGYLFRCVQPNSFTVVRDVGDTFIDEEVNHDDFEDIHDVLVRDDCCFVVGTSGNKISRIDFSGHVIESWQLEGESDSHHVNCLGNWNGRVVFSAFGEFTNSRGYKNNSLEKGYVQDLLTGERLIEGLSQPHSLTEHGNNLLVANSELKTIAEYSPDGSLVREKEFCGYTRGIFIHNGIIYLGLSISRNIDNTEIDSAALIALDVESWSEIGRKYISTSELYSIIFFEDKDHLLRLSSFICRNYIDFSSIERSFIDSSGRDTVGASSSKGVDNTQTGQFVEIGTLESLETQFQLQERRIEELKDRLTKMGDLLTHQRNEHEAELKKLESQIVKSLEREDRVQSKMRRQSELLRSQKDENEKIGLENADLQGQISKLSEMLNARIEENALLRDDNGELRLEAIRKRANIFSKVYGAVYRETGRRLRAVASENTVNWLRNRVPNPDGVSRHLAYTPAINGNAIFPVKEVPPATDQCDVFVLSIIDWDFRTQRPQHIARALSLKHRVFYVEMHLSIDGLQFRKVEDRVFVVRLPMNGPGHIQPYTGQPDIEQQRKWLEAFYAMCNSVSATSNKCVIVQHPFWWQLTRHLTPDFQLLFDCMDDISGFSNTTDFLLTLEEGLVSGCDRLVVSSQCLFEKLGKRQRPSLIRNAGEIGHFKSSLTDGQGVSAPSTTVPMPDGVQKIRIGYVGAIAEWFDSQMVKDAALQNPEFDFHLCGGVTVSEAEKLDELPNVRMYGEIAYDEVPSFIRGMDVMIIPFRLLPIIEACDPVKFYEYSAAAKPTISTRLPELNRAKELVFFASDAGEFSEQVYAAKEKALDPKFRHALTEYAANNTWAHRGHQFEQVISDRPLVSVVILAYGDPGWTKATLRSLFDGGAAYPNMEILVVDNGSTPEELAELRAAARNYDGVRIIENGENLGFAKGNNVGLTAATGEYVLLLNNDTYVAPGAINAMVGHLERNRHIGAVGPLTNNIGNEAKLPIDYSDMEEMKRMARDATTGYRGQYTPIRVLAYFAVMFRRADLQIFGLLSEDYGRGMFEDDDHCEVIRSKGYQCALAEDAFVHHHLSGTFSQLQKAEKQELFERNKAVFERKWGQWKPHKYRYSRPTLTTIDHR